MENEGEGSECKFREVGEMPRHDSEQRRGNESWEREAWKREC